MLIAFRASLVLILISILSLSVAADEVSDFFGYWAPKDGTGGADSCSAPDALAEGPWLIIGQNRIDTGFMGNCEDVGMWIDNGILKAAAACLGEGGVANFNGEFKLEMNELFYRKGKGGTFSGPFERLCSVKEIDEVGKRVETEIQEYQKKLEADSRRPFIPATSWAHSYPSQRAAEAAALNSCSGSCRIAINVRNACASVAIGERGGWGSGWAVKRKQADRFALRSCGEVDKVCAVRAWICSRGYGSIAIQNNP